MANFAQLAAESIDLRTKQGLAKAVEIFGLDLIQRFVPRLTRGKNKGKFKGTMIAFYATRGGSLGGATVARPGDYTQIYVFPTVVKLDKGSQASIASLGLSGTHVLFKAPPPVGTGVIEAIEYDDATRGVAHRETYAGSMEMYNKQDDARYRKPLDSDQITADVHFIKTGEKSESKTHQIDLNSYALEEIDPPVEETDIDWQGSPKQVKWAKTIKEKWEARQAENDPIAYMMNQLFKTYSVGGGKKIGDGTMTTQVDKIVCDRNKLMERIHEYLEQFQERLKTETDATFWIDFREDLGGRKALDVRTLHRIVIEWWNGLSIQNNMFGRLFGKFDYTGLAVDPVADGIQKVEDSSSIDELAEGYDETLRAMYNRANPTIYK